MLRKLSLMIAVIGMLLVTVMSAGAQAAAPQITAQPAVPQAVAGETFTVTIQVTGATEVYGSSFKLAYDPTAFEVVVKDNKAVEPGAFFASEPGFALKNAADPALGIVEYAMTLMQPAKPVSGDGVLGTVTFRALKDAPTTIATIEGKFVAPQFSEVGGRLVAQTVNQVEAVVDGAPAFTTANAALAANADVAQMFNNPNLNSASVGSAAVASVGGYRLMPSASDDTVLMAAGIFLLFGIVLLTVSVGLYTRMRSTFSLSQKLG